MFCSRRRRHKRAKCPLTPKLPGGSRDWYDTAVVRGTSGLGRGGKPLLLHSLPLPPEGTRDDGAPGVGWEGRNGINVSRKFP
jgi:hypothetical protein